MSPSDFLHKDAATQLCEHYVAAGATCTFSTNCEELLDAARQSFLRLEEPPGSIDFSLRFWVDNLGTSRPPWPKPYVRGLNHLVFAGFDEKSSMVADLGNRRVIGRFSAAMASDPTHWRNVIFPILMSILAGSIGLAELHASCVAKDGQGLVLIGPSGSGKSTLAMALSEAGFKFLSDDRTFCSIKRGRLLAYGLPRPLKLRPEAAHWFEDLSNREAVDVQNGEPVFYYEPSQENEGRQTLECSPALLVFLERQDCEQFNMAPMNRGEARRRIERELLEESPEAIEQQSATVEALLSLPCKRLRYGGRPQDIAEQLATLFTNDRTCEL